MIAIWKKLTTQLIGNYRVFRLRKDESVSPRTGRTHTFFALESPDWVNVVAVTPAGQLLLIRQYRHGTEEITLEIPGGMVDEGEAPVIAAARELLEETGYEAEAMIPIGVVAPNPAILNNRCHTFLARNARPVGPQKFDGSEDIALELTAIENMPELVRSGRISHALVIAAFHHYSLFAA